jgi:transposase InsO family protein
MRRRVKREILASHIRSCFEASHERYGSPRISAELSRQGTPVSRLTVSRYMKRMGLRSRLARKFRATTDSRHNNPVAPNLLEQNFNVPAPNKVWVSDITYLRVKDGFEYLTAIIDLYDRKVVGWSFSRNLRAENTVITALGMAMKRRIGAPKAPGLVLHSDRGVQYTCKAFTDILTRAGIVRSNSRRGNCWDNAVAESFFKTLKCELIYGRAILSAEQIRSEIFEYIECWYNKKRRHSYLEYLTIDEFWKTKTNPYKFLIAS